MSAAAVDPIAPCSVCCFLVALVGVAAIQQPSIESLCNHVGRVAFGFHCVALTTAAADPKRVQQIQGVVADAVCVAASTAAADPNSLFDETVIFYGKRFFAMYAISFLTFHSSHAVI